MHSKRRSDLKTGLWLIGIGILWYTGAWWPGILILFGLSIILDNLYGRIQGAPPVKPEPDALQSDAIEAEYAEIIPDDGDVIIDDDSIPDPVTGRYDSTPKPAAPYIPADTSWLPANCPACGAEVEAHKMLWESETKAGCPYCHTVLVKESRE